MNLRNIIKRATEFGTFSSSKNFFSFALKCIFYIIPAIILGNYTDITVQKIQKNKLLGNYILHYILLQTLIIIATLYVIILLSRSYTDEFQLTISGAFFCILYFGIQSNYIDMIKEYINS